MNIGIHYSNKQWEAPSSQDLQRLKLARPECIKTCLFTEFGYDQIETHKELRREFPNVLIVARLFAPMGGGPWSPNHFAQQFQPHIEKLKGVVEWFEVHNEPNHERGIEGFGTTQAEFKEFAHWAEQVLQLLKHDHPWAKWVFPGQLVDGGPYVNFWQANLEVIRKFDAWGVHCYWQGENHISREWGRAYEIAHELVPDKPIIITEFGDSTNNRTPQEKTPFYQEWYREVNKKPYILGTALYILAGTPDWINAPGIPNFDVIDDMARAIGEIPREAVQARANGGAQFEAAAVAEPPAPLPPPPTELRLGMVSNQDVITTFANVATQDGLGQWDLMKQAGLSLGELAAQRQAAYSKAKIDALPGLNENQRTRIKAELVRRARIHSADEAINFAPREEPVFLPSHGLLLSRPELMGLPLAPPEELQIDLALAESAVEKRVAKAWNRYGIALLAIADALGLEPVMVMAVVSNQADRRGIAPDGRLLIRFEPQIFYEKWGQAHSERFADHFKFDPTQPHQDHHWRTSAGDEWQACHDNQASEWAAFRQARILDETAAKLSLQMGLAEMMGFNYAILGYHSVDGMFKALATNERYQLFALFDFIGGESSDSRRLAALRDDDFETFAALHYGFGHAARYSVGLRQAAEAFRRLNPISSE